VSKYDLSSIRFLVSGAAPLGADLEKQVLQRISSLRAVKQAYGMTELSPAAIYSPCDAPHREGSAGKLIPNMEAKIIDIETQKELGLEQEGELWVRGPNVMLGYLDLPAETLQTIDSEGFLHTGDIARVDKDGYFYIVDRLKELIKYKGFQVAPAELESLLLEHPAIADAAVIPVPDEASGEVPKAYVVLKPNQTLSAEEVIKFIEGKVSPHKRLRGGVEFLPQIPKSPSGKILRRLLRPQTNSSQFFLFCLSYLSKIASKA
jgi:acyl-CoA synthetase (AMP-forming)/AMP-acid ligase II